MPDRYDGKIKAMVFAAGLGSRLKPWTDSHPKALVPVNGKSILQRNIERLQSFGIHEVMVNVHHFANQIMEAVAVNNGWGSSVTISDETEEVLETGGGLVKAKSFFSDAAAFITLNADILTNLDLEAMIRFHQSSGSLISMAVMQRPGNRVLLFDEMGQLCGWRNRESKEEKISLQKETLAEKAFSGIAAYQSSVFDKIKQTGKFSLTEVFLDLAKTEKITAFDHTGDRFVDVGKPGSVEIAERMFN